MATPVDTALAEAALRAIRRYGYAGTTMERIAEEAGISRATLYRRRTSKEQILQALSERAIDEYRAALWPALTGPGTGAERLESALLALCDSAEANLDLLIALRAQTDLVFHEEAGPDEQALTRSVFTEPLERLLIDGAADSSLREVPATETATLLFNLVGWTYVHLRTGHRWDPERARAATVDVVLSGLARR